jgi:hypothetical protein
MSHARCCFTMPLLVAFSSFFALPALHCQEKADVDPYKRQVTASWFSHPTRDVRAVGDQVSFDLSKDLASPLVLPSQTVDSSSEPSVVSSSDTAGVTDSLGGVATEPVLTSLNADSQVSSPTKSKSDWDKDPSAWKFIVYPVYAWVPFFSTSVTLPAVPTPPGGGGGGGGSVIPSGTTSGSLNGAAFTGAEIYKGKWSGMFTVLYAGLSATRTTPRTTLSMDFVYGQGLVERKVYKGLSLGAGFRRMALDLTATVDSFPSVRRSPGFWDPLLSATYRKQLDKKWRVSAPMDGGGFGVGSDIDIGAAAYADWRFAKHFGMTMGGAYLHFENTNTVLRKTFSIKPTMYGPTFGFGIYF